MEFREDSYRFRLIDGGGNSHGNGRVAVCLIKLSSLSFLNRCLELVPDFYRGDEQGMECEATFRHDSGAYLLYARQGGAEQLDIAIPKTIVNDGPVETIREMLRKEIGDLFVPEVLQAI